jgi:hypothetical protein
MESEGAAVKPAAETSWAEAAAQATEMVQSAAQQKSERTRLGACPR